MIHNYSKGEYRPKKGYEVVIKCPRCGEGGTFDTLSNSNITDIETSDMKFILGHRVCPNPECHCHIFFVYDKEADELITYPQIRINFDSKHIPETVKEALEEAIGCESINAYIASAIMVRRTLECLCDDRGAKKGKLNARIKDLRNKVILPDELFNALDNLRLLGNDAAHLESKDYENIGKDEVTTAIELTKEILKACYQYKDLVGKLESLKKNKKEENE